MAYRPSRAAQRRGSTRHKLAWAALLCIACSVFPDEATLPDGSGGTSGGGSNNATGGAATSGTGGRGSASGGRANGGRSTTGGSAGGTPEVAGSAGAPETGGAGASGGDTSPGGSGQGGTPSCPPPAVQNLPASVDAYITNAGNDARTNFGDVEQLLVSGVAMAEARALVNFDLAALKGQKVVHAQLRMVLSAPLLGERTLELYRVGRPWLEDKVTWLRASTSPAVNWTVEGGDIALVPSATRTLADAPAGTVLQFDVDADLQAFSSSGESNGFLLMVADGQGVLELSSSESLFADDRPQLVLELCP
jgi:hypothetical protein